MQRIFLSEGSIKTPTESSTEEYLVDFSDLLKPRERLVRDVDTGTHVLHLRHAITGSTLQDNHPNIWYSNNTERENKASEYGGCDGTLGSVTRSANSPFVAQLKSGFNTGLIRQFAPRLNSSVSVNVTAAKEFPQGCEKLDGAYYAEYSGLLNPSYIRTRAYSIQACMPANQTTSPWSKMRPRQDVQEVLYLNMSMDAGFYYDHRPSIVFKIVANTTAGYFELPNYFNGNTASSILEKDPNEYCDWQHCIAQGRFTRSGVINNTRYTSLCSHEKNITDKIQGILHINAT
jgi:hypothetical protein